MLPLRARESPYWTPTLSHGDLRVAVRVDAVDVAEVVPVRPLDRGDHGRVVELGARARGAEERVERERRQAAPAVDALACCRARRRGRDSAASRSRQTFEPRAVRPRRPLRVRPVGDVHEVLEQLAVADVDRLRDHVRVRVLRDRRVDDHAGMPLRVDVLLDRAARAADADRVERHAVALDEPLLRHDRRLGAEHEVVVRRRPRPARVDDRVALREPDVVEAAAADGVPWLWPIATPPSNV